VTEPLDILARAEQIAVEALRQADGNPYAALVSLVDGKWEVADLLVMDKGSELLALQQAAVWAAEKEGKE
jgi:hypothetical protein